MTITALIAIELALILVALGFLLSSQSNSMTSNVVAGVIILLGVCFLIIAYSKNSSLPSGKEAPIFGSLNHGSDFKKYWEIG